ncbi:MAG: VCBS repeat-containing protein [Bacteroidota bacterium]
MRNRFSNWMLIAGLIGVVFGTASAQTAFRAIPEPSSHLTFTNHLTEDVEWNFFRYMNVYNGGGVAVADFDRDGWPDLYFTGNTVPNRLFRNRGGFTFEDITPTSGTAGKEAWTTGVTIADVNADGYPDIYVCQAGYWVEHPALHNLLFINNGDLTFTEKAAEYGIDDPGRSVQATFFDYDGDNDLDLYVLNHPVNFEAPLDLRIGAERNPNNKETDRLYRNDGGHFTDVTDAAGVRNWGFGLGVIAADLNGDNRTDIYIANDYSEPDYYWINQGDGTFRNGIFASFLHTSNFSMGVDAGDFNNDGHLDLVVVDMMAQDNRRKKTNMSGMNPEAFWDNVNQGRHFQYMQNVLQLNNGNGTFGDIAELAGVANTDWSWSPLLADLDNDGFKDLIVTNGMRRDVRDNDFTKKLLGRMMPDLHNNWEALTQQMPVDPVANFVYRNQGDLTFSDVSQDWGFTAKGFSNGAAVADFDRDGDLDLVLNNVNAPATLLENKSDAGNRSLRVAFKGPAGNPTGLGATARLTTEKGLQFGQLTGTRGFQSASEQILHFGIAAGDIPVRLEIRWPDGKAQTLDLEAKVARIEVNHQNAGAGTLPPRMAQMLRPVKGHGLDFRHQERFFDDFDREVLLPHTYSQNGPMLATGDANGDGWDDLFIGGAAGQAGSLYVQTAAGTFRPAGSQPWAAHAAREDMGALFFDLEGDGDLDLYVVSGSNEFPAGDARYQDRLYRNDGDGTFSDATDLLGRNSVSGGRVRAADVDHDGDQDLFVTGRVKPGKYPAPVNSELFIWHNGRFLNYGIKMMSPAPTGMITDARFSDVDADGDPDLLLVGEWMSPRLFINRGQGNFVEATEGSGLEKYVGWWYSLNVLDVDGDGDEDFVAGNLGLNTKYRGNFAAPFLVYSGDLDENGQSDIVLGYHQDGVPYPVRGRQCSSEQIPDLKTKFPNYNTFAEASLVDIYGGALDKSLHYAATWMHSSWIENLGNGKFAVHALPSEAQVSPVNASVVYDVDGDGQQDLLLAGNMFGAEVETCRHDASVGLVLRGNGRGDFTPVPFARSGFFAQGDVKDLVKLRRADGRTLIVVARNGGPVRVFLGR